MLKLVDYAGYDVMRISCIDEPNWFARVFLRRKPRKVVFVGEERKWTEVPGGSVTGVRVDELESLWLESREKSRQARDARRK